MIFEAGKLGISSIVWTDDLDQLASEGINSVETLQNMLIFNGMNIKGSVYSNFYKNYTSNGQVKAYYITLGEFTFIMENKNSSDKLLNIINGILSNPKAEEALQNMLEAAESIFFQ